MKQHGPSTSRDRLEGRAYRSLNDEALPLCQAAGVGIDTPSRFIKDTPTFHAVGRHGMATKGVVSMTARRDYVNRFTRAEIHPDASP